MDALRKHFRAWLMRTFNLVDRSLWEEGMQSQLKMLGDLSRANLLIREANTHIDALRAELTVLKDAHWRAALDLTFRDAEDMEEAQNAANS